MLGGRGFAGRGVLGGEVVFAVPCGHSGVATAFAVSGRHGDGGSGVMAWGRSASWHEGVKGMAGLQDI